MFERWKNYIKTCDNNIIHYYHSYWLFLFKWYHKQKLHALELADENLKSTSAKHHNYTFHIQTIYIVFILLGFSQVALLQSRSLWGMIVDVCLFCNDNILTTITISKIRRKQLNKCVGFIFLFILVCLQQQLIGMF